MKSQLLLPKLDREIICFLENYPPDPFIHPKYDRIYKIGIKYWGFIYRQIECESPYECQELTKFLLNTGYVRKDDPIRHYDMIFEIVD